MQVTINGESQSIEDGWTVANLVTSFQLQPRRVAVEINEKLVPRKDYEATTLHDGDRIEVVTFVGGG